MTDATTLTALRNALGISVNEMADAIGLDGDNAGDRVREMERGAKPVTGPMQRVLAYMAQAVELDEDAEMFSITQRVLPRFLDCADLERDDPDSQIIMHTRFPRFYAWLPDDLPDDVRDGLEAEGIPVIDLPEEAGLNVMVMLFLDRPVRDPAPVIQEAARLVVAQALRDLRG